MYLYSRLLVLYMLDMCDILRASSVHQYSMFMQYSPVFPRSHLYNIIVTSLLQSLLSISFIHPQYKCRWCSMNILVRHGMYKNSYA